jgi:2-hydroxy-3-oxopropionate reductase
MLSFKDRKRGVQPMSERAPRIGFIGLGIMGKPMARNLLAAGYKVTVHSRSSGPVDELAGEGAAVAASPAAVASSSDVVITMLPDTPDVEQVALGDDGLASSGSEGLLYIDMSSIDPPATRRIAAVLAERGIAMLDAPVSGGERGAIDGTLSIMVGGPEAEFRRAEPIFQHLGQTIVHVGDAGAGQVTKACNQLVVGMNIEAVAEALALARQSGVDQGAVRQVLLGGFAASRVLESHGSRMIDGAFQPGFRVRLHAKDARIVRSLADATGAVTPAFDVVADQLDQLVRSGRGDLDHSALYTLVSQEVDSSD